MKFLVIYFIVSLPDQLPASAGACTHKVMIIITSVYSLGGALWGMDVWITQGRP